MKNTSNNSVKKNTLLGISVLLATSFTSLAVAQIGVPDNQNREVREVAEEHHRNMSESPDLMTRDLDTQREILDNYERTGSMTNTGNAQEDHFGNNQGSQGGFQENSPGGMNQDFGQPSEQEPRGFQQEDPRQPNQPTEQEPRGFQQEPNQPESRGFEQNPGQPQDQDGFGTPDQYQDGMSNPQDGFENPSEEQNNGW